MKVKVTSDGTIHAVYSDQLKNMGLGDMQVSRASNVEFDHQRQEWEARTPDGELIASGPKRDEVIRQEVDVIERRL
jgi:hypothetical protein